MENFVAFNYINLFLLALIAIRIFWKQNEKTLVLIILTSLFSILASLQYLLLNAPDVAITEASIGACLTTVFILKATSFSRKNIDKNYEVEVITDNRKKYFQVLICSLFFGLFICLFAKTSFDFPKILSEELPLLYNDTIKYYILQTRDFLKFPNIVTAIIISFRGYDTLIETIVILTAAISILAILTTNDSEVVVKKSILFDKTILTNMVMMIIPFMALFAFYIQAHGEESPGGGFQSGSILACTLIGYALTISESAILKYLKNSFFLRAGALGILLYFSIGLIPVLKDQNFLDHNYFLCSISSGLECFAKSQKAGIFLAELGVGITVFATMSLIFFNLRIGKANDCND